MIFLRKIELNIELYVFFYHNLTFDRIFDIYRPGLPLAASQHETNYPPFAPFEAWLSLVSRVSLDKMMNIEHKSLGIFKVLDMNFKSLDVST